jgi:two-component system sensor histidine kinase/response regulator
VDVAVNGLEALDALAHLPYDLVFMDCQMPEMDGFEATAVLRAREVLGERHIPVIAMTANAMHGDRERCLAAGMDDYVSKPTTSGELKAMLRKWVQPSQIRYRLRLLHTSSDLSPTKPDASQKCL